MWPGFGENSRILKWIFERCAGMVDATDTAIGRMPVAGSLDVEGLDLTSEDLAELLRVDSAGWQAELPLIEEHFAQFGDRLPSALRAQLEALTERLQQSSMAVGS